MNFNCFWFKDPMVLNKTLKEVVSLSWKKCVETSQKKSAALSMKKSVMLFPKKFVMTMCLITSQEIKQSRDFIYSLLLFSNWNNFTSTTSIPSDYNIGCGVSRQSCINVSKKCSMDKNFYLFKDFVAWKILIFCFNSYLCSFQKCCTFCDF